MLRPSPVCLWGTVGKQCYVHPPCWCPCLETLMQQEHWSACSSQHRKPQTEQSRMHLILPSPPGTYNANSFFIMIWSTHERWKPTPQFPGALGAWDIAPLMWCFRVINFPSMQSIIFIYFPYFVKESSSDGKRKLNITKLLAHAWYQVNPGAFHENFCHLTFFYPFSCEYRASSLQYPPCFPICFSQWDQVVQSSTLRWKHYVWHVNLCSR